MMHLSSAFIGMTTIVRDNYVEFYHSSIVSQRHQHHAFAKSRSLLIPDLASAASSSSHTSTREEDNNDSERSRRGVHVTVDTVVTAWSTYLDHQNSHEGNSVNNYYNNSSNDVGEMTTRTKSMATSTAAASSSNVSLLASAASKKSTSSSINVIDTPLSSFIGHRIAGNHSNSDKDNTCIGSSSSSIDVIHMDTPARKSLPPFLQLRSVPNKGLGVFSTVNLPAGTYLGEYTGEILLNDHIKDRRYVQEYYLRTLDDVAWCASRLDRGQTMTGCYLYGISLPPTSSSTSLEKKRIYIDAEDEYSSTWTRFINHAFPPHANVCPRSIHESYTTGQPRVWFVTNRHVHRGEELCFDYGDDYWLDDDTVV